MSKEQVRRYFGLEGIIEETEGKIERLQSKISEEADSQKVFNSQVKDGAELQDTLGRSIDSNNAKILDGTKLIEAQTGALRVLFHGSNSSDFDKFDSSRIGQNGDKFGKGAYFAFNKSDAETYGHNVSEWFAKVTKIYNDNAKFSEEELTQIFNEYKKDIESLWENIDLDSFLNKMFGKTSVEQMDLLTNNITGLSEDDLLKKLGYQGRYIGLEQGSGIVVFDIDNIVKAKNLLSEISSKSNKTPASSETNRLQQQQDELQEELNETGQQGETAAQNIIDANKREINSYEDLKATITELQSIYDSFQRAKYPRQYSEYIDNTSGRLIDTSDYNSVDATEKNLNNLKDKILEIYKLYKNIQSAIKNNNGWFKGEQYDQRDLESLIQDFKAYAQAYHELQIEHTEFESRISEEIGVTPEYMEKLESITSKMTKDFKGYTQEVIANSEAVRENNVLFDKEQEELSQSNAELQERYQLLRQLVMRKGKELGADTDKLRDAIPYISDLEEWDLNKEFNEPTFTRAFGSNHIDVLKEVAQILGFEIPQAADKASEAMREVGEKTDTINESPALFEEDSGQLAFVQNLTEAERKLSEVAQETAQEVRASNDQIEGQMSFDDYLAGKDAIEKQTAAIEENTAKKRENARVDAQADDTAQEVRQEADEMEKAGTAAEDAAKQKKEFAEANENVLKSIVESLKGLEQEGAAFDSLNKLIKTLSKDNDMDKTVKGLEKIRQVLSSPIDDNSMISALKELAAQGEALSNLATVLKNASKTKLVNAEKAVNKTEADSGASKEELQNYKDEAKIIKEIYDLKIKNSKIKIGEYQSAENENRIKELTAQQNALLTERSAKYKENAAEAKKVADIEENMKANLSASITSEMDSATKQIDGLVKSGKYLENYQNNLIELKGQIKELNRSRLTMDTSEFEGQWKKLKQTINDTIGEKSFARNKAAAESSLAKLGKSIDDIMAKNSRMGRDFKKQFENLKLELDETKSVEAVERLKAKIVNLEAELVRAGQTGRSFLDTVRERLTGVNAQLIAQYLSFQDLIRYGREIAQTVISVDTALTELRKVSGETTDRLQESFRTSAETAKELGATITDVINQTADWSRIGYDIGEAEELARVSTLFQTVGDNMTAETASQAMISTIKAYGMGVDEAESIVDKYNEVANNFAIDTEGISEAIERSGASLKAAGNDLNQSLGLIVAANNSLQNPSSVGQMLKTIGMRLRGANASDLEALGIDTEGMTQGIKSIVKQFKAMADIDIMEGTDYKSTFRILDELHDKWKSLNDAERAALTEAVAGKRGGSVMASLMENWEDAQKVVETAAGSYKSAEREQEAYAQSIQYSIDVAKASLQELATDFLSSSFLKSAIDLGSKIINILDEITESIGGLGAALSVLGLRKLIIGLDKPLEMIKGLQEFIKIFTRTKEVAETAEALEKTGEAVEMLSEGAEALETMDNVADGISETSEALEAISKTAEGVEETAEALEATGDAAKGVAESVKVVGETTGSAAIGSKSLATGLNGVAGAGTMATSSVIALGAAIAALAVGVGAAIAVKVAYDDLRRSAEELGRTYQNTKQNLDQYKQEIIELRAKIDDSSTSYDEAKEARERLLIIQNELIDKYGAEGAAINVLTGDVNALSEAFKHLSKAQWEAAKEEFNGNLKGWDWMVQQIHGASDNLGVMIDEMENANISINIGFATDALKESIKRINSDAIIQTTADEGNIVELNGSLQNVYDTLIKIKGVINEDTDPRALKSVVDAIDQTKDKLNDYKGIYNEMVFQERIMDGGDIEALYSQYIKAYENYQTAISEENEEGIQASYDTLINLRERLQRDLADSDLLSDEEKTSIQRFFDDLIPEFKTKFAREEFVGHVKLEVGKDGENAVQDKLDSLSKDGNFHLSATMDINDDDLSQNYFEPGKMPILTVSNESTAINFTPYLTDENGNIIGMLTKGELQSYAEDVLNGADDYKNLQIGAEFNGEDAKAQAEATAREIQDIYSNMADSSTTELIDAISKFPDLNTILQMDSSKAYRESATQDYVDAFNVISQAATEAGISVKDMLEDLSGEHIINLPKFDTKALLSDINRIKKNAKIDFKIDDAKLEKAINSLTAKEYETAFSIGESRWKDVLNNIQEAEKANGNANLTADEYAQIIRNVEKEWEEVNGQVSDVSDINFNMEGLAKTGTSIKNLGKLYASFVQEVENKSPTIHLDLTEIEGLRAEISSVVGAEEFNIFESIVTNANSSAEEIQKAFDDIVTSYATAQIDMQGASEQTAEILKSQLVEWGLTKESVDAFVNSLVAEAKEQEIVTRITAIANDENNRYGDSEDAKIQALIDEAEQLGLTKEQLMEYLLKATEAGFVSFNGDTSFLERLRSELGLSIDEINRYKTALSSIGSLTNKGINVSSKDTQSGGLGLSGKTERTKKVLEDVARASAVWAEKEKKEKEKESKAVQDNTLKWDKNSEAVNANNRARSGGGGGGGGGGSKADEIKEETDALQKLSSELDAVQDAWKRLQDIQKDYTETGRITVDQAQELINMDYRYLAMLNLEGDAMSVNEAAFQSLAQAKLSEMKITLIRNAIDLVNTFVDEAKAAEYLTNSYFNLGVTAAQTAGELMALYQAVVSVSGMGLTQAQAANTVLAGVLNAIQMLEHVDWATGPSGSEDRHDYDHEDHDYDHDDHDTHDDAEETKKEFEELIDYFERRVQVLQHAISLLGAELENVNGAAARNTLLDAQSAYNRQMMDEYREALEMYRQRADEALEKLPSDIAERVRDGAVAMDQFIGDANEDVVEAIKDYEQWAGKVEECEQQIAELEKALRQLELEKFNNIMNDFQAQIDLRQSSGIDLISRQIALLQEAGQMVGEGLYEAQREMTLQQIETLQAEKDALLQQMKEALDNGVTRGSEEWLEMQNALVGVEGQILDAERAVEEFDNAILALHTEVFNQLMDRFEGFRSELQNLIGLFDDAEVAGADGNWTKEGLAQLGLLAQQYELAREQADQYAMEIEQLDRDYADGKYSATEYAERLAELKEGQWAAVNASEAAKDAMIELNRQRINVQIKGINEEIDAYKKLIDEQIKSLDVEKEQRDYERSVRDSSKKISDIERKIAALALDNSAASIAKRKKLEEELAQAKQDLADLEYDHSVETQKDALEAMAQNYEDEKNGEIEALEKEAEDTEAILAGLFETVRENSATIGAEIERVAADHGINVSSVLTNAWNEGGAAIASYDETLTDGTSNFIGELLKVENEVNTLKDDADATASELAGMFETQSDNLVSELNDAQNNEADLERATDDVRDALVDTLEGDYDTYRLIEKLSGIEGGLGDISEAADDARSSINEMTGAANEAKNAYDEMRAAAEAAQVAMAAAEDHQPSGGGGGGGSSGGGGGNSEPRDCKIVNYAGVAQTGLLTRSEAEEWLRRNNSSGYYYIATGYAKGLKKADEDELAWTQEKGDEIILSPNRSAILTPLKSGDSVLTHDMTENLWNLAKMNPKDIFAKQQLPEVPIQNNTQTNNTLTFGSMIQVSGNVNDSMAMMQTAVKAAQREITASFKKLNDGVRK